MKRGNTALKRGVGLASAFALAIAGAVIAAPAASAAGTADAAVAGVRATPIADAAFIEDDALITGAAGYDNTNDYATDKTGAVPVIGVGDGQAVSSAQVAIPLGTSAKWTAGQTIEVTLGGGATFASTPSVDITRQAVQLGTLASKAGWAGPTLFGSPSATEAPLAEVAASGADKVSGANNSLPSNRAQRITAAVDTATSTVLTLTLPTADPNIGYASATAGYLVSISGISVNVKDTVAAGAVTLTVNGKATTLGYVSPFTFTADGGYVAQKDGSVDLPAIKVAETSKAGFDAGTGNSTKVTFAVSGEKAKVADPAVALTGTGSATLGTAATGTLTIAAASVDATKLESSTVTGWSASNLKIGTDLTVSIDPVGIGASGGTSSQAAVNTNTGGIANFSATPAGSSAGSLTIKQDTDAARIAGKNRYDTAAQIASDNFGPVNAVVLANGVDAKNGFDALSANYLAGAKGAPILLTTSADALPSETETALVSVLKGSAGDSTQTVTLYVLGGKDSVSDAAAARAQFIAKAAVNSGVTVKIVRVAGTNRYKTSAAVVTEVGKAAIGSYNLGKGSLNTAFLASGTSNADALAAGAVSAAASLPVLLTSGSALDEDVAKALKDNDIKQVIILGKTDRVSAAVETALTDAGVTSIIRIAGDDRYATAADINSTAIAKPADGGLNLALGTTAYLASGNAGWADALAIGPLAGNTSGAVSAVLTTGPTSLASAAEKFLKDNKAGLDWIEAVGGADRVSADAVATAKTAIGF